jgi:uncharacterized membrane protein (DUF4010 family)
MTKPTINTQVSIGNIVSWALVLSGFIAGYVKMQEVQAQTSERVKAMEAHSGIFEAKSISKDEAIVAQLADLRLDLAVIKSNVMSINEKVDDIRAQRKASSDQ